MKKKTMKQTPSIPNNTLRKTTRWNEPCLRFSPTAWAKLLYFRDRGDTEIGGFGITLAEDLLYVEEFVTVKQLVSIASVSFEDEAIADLFEDQVDQGRKPEQFARIWIHSHPGDCPNPSRTDEETFSRVFGRCDWAIMFIIAKGNQLYARLRFNVGPGGEIEIPVQIDYANPFAPSDEKAWEKEYQAHIQPVRLSQTTMQNDGVDNGTDDWEACALSSDIIDQLEMMEPAERQMVWDELAGRSSLEQEESEVLYE